MADVFTQLYIHLIFCPAKRQSLIQPEWEERLHKFITGVVEKRGHKLLAIGGMPDHIHIFFGLKPAEGISDLVREIKNASNSFVKNEKLSKYTFNWQNGYAAFSYSRSQIDRVCKYILNQKEHHKKQRLKEEFMKMCEDHDIEIGRKIIFDFFDT
jgi:REP element-mobilizing transposase RayT